MSKAVMISIQPRWCELIAIGKKTVEVRKTRPKLETPFKCYIYETKGKTEYPTFIDEEGHTIYEGRGQVIGEFVCDKITEIDAENAQYLSEAVKDITIDEVLSSACLSAYDILDYLVAPEYSAYEYCKGYGWHISDLKIYGKPKELSEFQRACTHNEDCGSCKRWDTKKYDCISGITRPPQSWCYVEEVQ